ncbi:MAG TPA: T9SS type A sorting domain-containing protein [Candidatus Krumholzibacteria bacterium]|nr:T9SS type A sorting domain-containing protein [Candidatus Krumholzibacteria bacterium]
MKKVLLQSLTLALSVALVSSAAYAKKSSSGYGSYSRTANWNEVWGLDNQPIDQMGQPLHASAAATTVVLNSSKFDSGASCTANGWTTVDVTKQTGDWWHVDDFTAAPWAGTKTDGGITYSPVQGTKSMWMAALPSQAVGGLFTTLCGYAALPGYGNGWNQAFCSTACKLTSGGPTADLDVAFKLKFDSEPSYDGTVLEYTTDCAGNVGWTEIDGGATAAGWSGGDSISVAGSYAVGAGPVKVRLHFTADTSWSNQDGYYTGFGVAVDSLSWEDSGVEDFEGVALGAHGTADWTSCNTPGYGDYLALFKKATGANYEDQCLDNLSCYWAAINGSTEFYTCGTPSQPTQKVVPHVNVRGEYIANEIWSPTMSLLGSSGSDFRLRYTVYRDLPLDNLIFHVWHVRTIDNTGCPASWADRNFVYYGDNKDWLITENAIGTKINVATGDAIQVAIGVIDMCPFWCGIFGTGACHSPAPYIDSVKVLRIGTVGPQWDIRDIDTFNDNFATDGTITGTARIDEAIDIKPSASATYTPGDSAIVLYLLDPKYVDNTTVTGYSGLVNDPNVSTFVGRHKTKNAVYGYFTVTPFNASKIGPAISEGPGGSANRWPYMGTIVAGGKTWAKVRMDYTYTGNATNPGDGHSGTSWVANRFNIDVNDNLFTPGDTINYFYSATSLDGTTYFSTNWGSTSSIADVAANPMEVTILPAGGFNRGGDVLYVDGADSFGVQNYYDGAFLALGLADKIDRFDVRGPSSGVSNRLGGRVYNVAQQLNACYRKIIWDSGPLSITLGDGTGDPEKTDDYLLMNTFLGNLTNPGGVMLLGDRQSEYLDGYAGASAVSFRSTYMPFTLINNNHRLAPTLYAISPHIIHWPGRAYSDDFIIFGGCPALNDFDVIGASGTSRVEMSYNTATNPNGAVLSNVNGLATVIMTGFSMAYVRDDELDGISDRAKFLRDSIVYMGNPLGQVVGAGDSPKVNSLSQNYPNPFNPQTSIAFSIKDRGAVSLKVYNVNGELVRTLVNESRTAGTYTEKWDGRNDAGSTVSSGVYFYKLVTNNFSQTKKMVLLK